MKSPCSHGQQGRFYQMRTERSEGEIEEIRLYSTLILMFVAGNR